MPTEAKLFRIKPLGREFKEEYAMREYERDALRTQLDEAERLLRDRGWARGDVK